jgi:hypothetical protein
MMKNLFFCFLMMVNFSAFADVVILQDSLIIGQQVPGFTLKNLVPNQAITISLAVIIRKKVLLSFL